MTKVANWLIDLIYAMVMGILNLLPDSPLRFHFDGAWADMFGYVNYFVPFGTCVQILVAFTGAVAVWYVLRWILRLAQYIQ